MLSSPARRAAALLALTLAATGCGTVAHSAPTTPAAMPSEATGPHQVQSVVDGDTIKVTRGGRTITVRLLGIDTPEVADPRKPVQCFGEEASTRTRTLLTGKSVYLEAGPETVDKYGRTLAYVWDTNHSLVNLQLVADGYAHAYTYDRARPGKYDPQLRAAERSARTAALGLWSPQTCNGAP